MVVAIIVNDENQVLISQRPEHVHLGGYWEFPGGKVEQNENIEEALFREIKEELSIEVLKSRPLIKVTHHYDDKSVLLDVWKVNDYSGDIKGNEGQKIDWKTLQQLGYIRLPEADLPIIQALRLPEACLVTGEFSSLTDYMDRVESAINNNIKLIQCRITNKCLQQHGDNTVKDVINNTDVLCRHRSVTMMLNAPDKFCIESTNNYHLNSRKLMSYSSRPDCDLLSASCHSEVELIKAVELGVDFALLSPVQHTASHPDKEPLGWSRFAEMLRGINIPVYALGGVTQNNLIDAWKAGAQGVASMGSLWNK